MMNFSSSLVKFRITRKLNNVRTSGVSQWLPWDSKGGSAKAIILKCTIQVKLVHDMKF